MSGRLVIGLALGAVVAASGCATGGSPGAPTLLDVGPAAVSRVVVEAGGRTAEFTQTGKRVWRAGRGASEEGAALLLGAEERLFPLRGYRRMRVDSADPSFGLADPAATLTVETGHGPARTVVVGAATFNGGGFYARLDHSGGELYLLARSVLADLRSLAEGRPVTLPQVEDARIKQALEDNHKEANGPPAESPWIRQAVDAGADLPEAGR